MSVDIESQAAVLTGLPEDAASAWEDGDTWESECPEEGSRITTVSAPLHHEATGTWERQSIESRVTVTKGALVERFYAVDPRGKRALRRVPKWGSDRHRSVREKFSPENRQKRWAGYWEWVAETGRDPIGEFSVPETAGCGWRLMCRERQKGVFVRYARRRESARPLRKSTDYISVGELPRRLRTYCRLREGMIRPEAVQSRSDLAGRLRSRGTGRIAGRQVLDSELRRMPDGDHEPLETFPKVFFVDVTIEEQIPRERQKEILRARAEEKLRSGVASGYISESG
jgi:hypothetical protein